MVEFECRQDAEKAIEHMNNGSLDGLRIIMRMSDEKVLEGGHGGRGNTNDEAKGRRRKDRSESKNRQTHKGKRIENGRDN